MSWPIVYEFTIGEPYLLKNKLDAMKYKTPYLVPKYKTRWYWLILQAIGRKPAVPLSRAWVNVERGSYGVPPDPDGLENGFAPILDLLTLPRTSKKVGLGLIRDDSADCLTKRTQFHHVKTGKGRGYTKVTIYGRVGKNERLRSNEDRFNKVLAGK